MRMQNQEDAVKRIELKNASKSTRAERLWQFLLAALLLIGILRSYLDCVTLSGMHAWILSAAGGAALLCCAVLSSYPRTSAYATLPPVAAGVIWTVIFGIREVYGGFLGVMNYLISWWNLRYDDGKNLFQGETITQQGIEAFSVVMILAVSAVVWEMVQKRRSVLSGILLMLFLTPGLILGYLSTVTASILLTAGVGMWLHRIQGGRQLQRGVWTAGLGILFFTLAICVGGESLKGIEHFRKESARQIRDMRFGEDSLPEGNLYKADSMLDGDEETLEVATRQVKSMYLRGFVGGCYQEGIWTPLKNSAFGGENAGMMKWLKKQGFYTASQYFAYASIKEQEEIPKNQVEIKNIGARRNYIYMPYSAQKPKKTQAHQEQDANFQSSSFLGSREYAYLERSENIPAELLHVSGWVSSPSRKEEKAYQEEEAVYRSFVYENYLDVDDSLVGLMDFLFWADAKPEEKDGIYTSTDRIRTILREMTSYKANPEAVPEGEEPVRWFLTEGRQGNAALYATTAVQAYRANGIPARYAEGYLLKEAEVADSENGNVTLTRQDSHAWAEVYMDGIGWVPIDVTPGFYYDTYALMEMVQKPQGIQQTAAVEDAENDADQVNDKGQKGTEEEKDKTSETIFQAVLGAGVMVLIVITVLIVFLECRRYLRLRRLAQNYRDAGEEGKARILCHVVIELLHMAGIEAIPGWQAKETEQALTELVPAFQEGEYIRVSYLIEKHIYGDEELRAHEKRALASFIEKMNRERKRLKMKRRLRIRYCRWRIKQKI